ncbi:MAG: aminotransferase class I/II-fold pyridoxal phosphate-dependent enzyme [Pseudomonadota bacterium]
MQVLILAAGLGRRLDPLTQSTPKCLVPVNDTPIIVNALKILTQYPLERIVIVIGHLGEQVQRALGPSFAGVPIEYVVNPHADSTNNIYSLWLAKAFLCSDTILMECDVYFQPAVIRPLMTGPIENTALVDRFQPHMDGTVVEIDEHGSIHRMIPSTEQAEGFGYADTYKTVNIYSFQGSYLEQVFRPALDNYIARHGSDIYYELVIAALIESGSTAIRTSLVNQAEWIEIDDFVDLERAEILFSTPEQRFEKVKSLHGGFWRYPFIDYAYLHNLYFPPPAMLSEMQRNLRPLLCSYPSAMREILTYLQNWTGVGAENLLIANGASEIITTIKRRLLKKMTVSVPTFNEYYDGLDHDQVAFHYTEADDFRLDAGAFIKTVRDSGSNLAVVVNPDMPSGQLIPRDELLALCRHLSHLDAIVLDESFIEFAASDDQASLLADIDAIPNLLIVRSLSKDLGVPGLRLGYVASSNDDMLRALRADLPIWNINGLAEYFLAVLPKYRREFRAACEQVMSDRDYLFRKLSSIAQLRVYPSAGNYFLVCLPPDCPSDRFTEHLFVHGGVLVKDCRTKAGFKDRRWVRLAVRSREETDYLMPRLEASLEQVACR